MANEIDLVVGQAAFDKITELIKRLGDVDIAFGNIATNFSNLGKGANPQSTAELAKLTAENQKLNKALNDLKASYTTIDTELAKNTKLITDNTKATLEETIAKREKNSQTTLEIKAGKELAQTYSQLDAQHKLAVKSAQDLAVQHNRQGKDYEAAKLRANELGKQLKVIDTDIGKHTRNVGNYSSSWNGLGNSINQLTREAPAFANSVQTGFMALSNNIPILTDELGVLIQKNKDLQKDGKPTESILKTVAGAFFSWQTAISLGVTILTVYGAKIWELVTAGTAAEKSQKALSDSMAEGTKNANEEVYKLDVLYRTSQNVTLSIEQRKKAVDQLQKQYPSYFENIKDEDILIGRAKIAYDELKVAIIASSRAKAISSQMDKLAAEEFEKETKLRLDLQNEMTDLYDKRRQYEDAQKLQREGKATKEDVAYFKSRYDWQLITVKGYNKEILNLQNQLTKDSDIFIKERMKQEEQAAKLEADRAGKGLGKGAKPKEDKSVEEAAKKEEEIAKKDYETKLSNLERLKEIDKDDLEFSERVIQEKLMLSAALTVDELLIAEAIFEEKKRLAKGDVQLIQQATNEKLTAEENAQQENLKRVKKYYEDLNKETAEYYKNNPPLFVESPEAKKAREKDENDRKKSLEEAANYLQSFGSEFASNSGLTETFKMMSGEIEGFGENTQVTFNAVAESAQEMFNKMASFSQAHYEQDYARLEAQKEASLKFAGDSSAAKEKIEKDFAKKKKAIDKQKFEEDKKISMVNIVIDTAQAIMSTYKKTGFFGTPLAIIMGAFGAAQLAMVASQEFPAYAKGTDNHSGGLMLVNDGQGSNFQEKVILPSGKVIRPQGRNVLMDAPKGTKVLNHEQQLFEMLQSNNISMSNPQYQGMTPDEMDEILGKHFGNIKTQNTIFDKNGFQSYVKNGNSITRSNSNRSQAIGISV